MTVSGMTYTNWDSGQPSYHEQSEACVHLMSGLSYKWHDTRCSTAFCSVCQLDIKSSARLVGEAGGIDGV